MDDRTEPRIGDRVTFKKLGQVVLQRGVIVDETENGHGWQVVQDGTGAPRGVHKSFCVRETVEQAVNKKFI